jgi:tRNA (cmo5U34)-methyltransferase
MTDQWHFDPASYLAMVRSGIPAYDRLQQQLADATRPEPGTAVERVLDLGSGTGMTARAVLDRHPGATLIGVDSSPAMLDHARRLVASATFVEGRLEEPLPDGPFDLVVSAFAVHHLPSEAKADLFRRVASSLGEGGRFVLCDVVVPSERVERPVPLEPGVDLPDTLADQVRWMRQAGLDPSVVACEADLAIVSARRGGIS